MGSKSKSKSKNHKKKLQKSGAAAGANADPAAKDEIANLAENKTDSEQIQENLSNFESENKAEAASVPEVDKKVENGTGSEELSEPVHIPERVNKDLEGSEKSETEAVKSVDEIYAKPTDEPRLASPTEISKPLDPQSSTNIHTESASSGPLAASTKVSQSDSEKERILSEPVVDEDDSESEFYKSLKQDDNFSKSEPEPKEIAQPSSPSTKNGVAHNIEISTENENLAYTEPPVDDEVEDFYSSLRANDDPETVNSILSDDSDSHPAPAGEIDDEEDDFYSSLNAQQVVSAKEDSLTREIDLGKEVDASSNHEHSKQSDLKVAESPKQDFETELEHEYGKEDLAQHEDANIDGEENDSFYNELGVAEADSQAEPPVKALGSLAIDFDDDDDFLDDDDDEEDDGREITNDKITEPSQTKTDLKENEISATAKPAELRELSLAFLEEDDDLLSDDDGFLPSDEDDDLDKLTSQLKESQTIKEQSQSQHPVSNLGAPLEIDHVGPVKPAQPIVKSKPSVPDFQTDRKSFDLPMDFIPQRPKRVPARIATRTSTPQGAASPYVPPPQNLGSAQVSPKASVPPRAPAPPRTVSRSQSVSSASKYAPTSVNNSQIQPPSASPSPLSAAQPSLLDSHTQSSRPTGPPSVGSKPPLQRASNPDPFGFPGMQELSVKKRPSRVFTPQNVPGAVQNPSQSPAQGPPQAVTPQAPAPIQAQPKSETTSTLPPTSVAQRAPAPQRISRAASFQSNSPYTPQTDSAPHQQVKEQTRSPYAPAQPAISTHQEAQGLQPIPGATVSAYSYHAPPPSKEATSVFAPNPLDFANSGDAHYGSTYAQGPAPAFSQQPLSQPSQPSQPSQLSQYIPSDLGDSNNPNSIKPPQAPGFNEWSMLSATAVSSLPIPLLGPKGPLKNKKKDIEKWIDERVRELGSGYPGALLYKIMLALLKDTVEQKNSETLKALEAYRVPLFSNSGVTKQVPTNVSSQIFSLISSGEQELALKTSLEAREYAHALIIAQSLGKSQWQLAVGQYVAEELREFAAPLAFIYRCLAAPNAEAGRDAIAELKPRAQTAHVDYTKVDSNLKHWANCAAALIGTKSAGALAALQELGKLLEFRGLLEQAHTCFALCNLPLGTDDFKFPLSTKDAEHHSFDSYVIAEIYEYIQGRGSPLLLPQKLHFAELLAGAGYSNEGLKIAETVASVLKATKNAPVQLTEAAAHVVERCSHNVTPPAGGWLQRKLSRPNIEKAWVSSFNKFVSGEDENVNGNEANGSNNNLVQRPSSAIGTGDNKLDFAPPQRQSYTPGPDVVNSFNGLSPIHVRPSSSSSARPATLAETEEEYAGQNYAARQYVPPIAPSRGYTPSTIHSASSTPAPMVSSEALPNQVNQGYGYPIDQGYSSDHQGYLSASQNHLPPHGYPQHNTYGQAPGNLNMNSQSQGYPAQPNAYEHAPGNQSMNAQAFPQNQGYSVQPNSYGQPPGIHNANAQVHSQNQGYSAQPELVQAGFQGNNGSQNFQAPQFQNQAQYHSQYPNPSEISNQPQFSNQGQFPVQNQFPNQAQNLSQNVINQGFAHQGASSVYQPNTTPLGSQAPQAQGSYEPQTNQSSSLQPEDVNKPKAEENKANETKAQGSGSSKQEDTEDKSEDTGTKSRGWFSWLKKDDPNSKKPIAVNLGNGPEVYYDKEIGRWVQKGQPKPEQKKGPPPPPKTATSVPVPGNSQVPQPPAGPGLQPSENQSHSLQPGQSVPPAGFSTAPSTVPSPYVSAASTPAPPGQQGIVAQPGQLPGQTGPPGGSVAPAPRRSVTGGGIDDILAAANTTGRNKRRTARNRYVSTTETGMPQGMSN